MSSDNEASDFFLSMLVLVAAMIPSMILLEPLSADIKKLADLHEVKYQILPHELTIEASSPPPRNYRIELTLKPPFTIEKLLLIAMIQTKSQQWVLSEISLAHKDFLCISVE